MKIAAFSDIHSNILALDNVLQDIELQKPDLIFCLGDLVGYGPRPNQVVKTIRGKTIQTVMGNYDEGIGYEIGDCGCAYLTDLDKNYGQKSIEWTAEKVTSKNKKYLRSLHEKIELEANGYKLLLVHGSPRRINEYLHENRSERSLSRILESIDADILVCGHTHKPYHKVARGIHIINDGSVGKPKDGDPRACYALIDLGDMVSVEFRRVNYPIKKVAEEIVKYGLPKAFAEALYTGT